jgi:hypothetical protein
VYGEKLVLWQCLIAKDFLHKPSNLLLGSFRAEFGRNAHDHDGVSSDLRVLELLGCEMTILQ